MPKIREKLLPHGRSGPIEADMTVIHAMAERIRCGKWEENAGIGSVGEVLDAWEYLNRAGLSAHRLVYADGSQDICRYDDQVAWHAKGYNMQSRGIELLVPGVHDAVTFLRAIAAPDWPTRAALATAAAIAREWSAMGATVIVRHNDIDPKRKKDPGQGFRWPGFLEQVHGWG